MTAPQNPALAAAENLLSNCAKLVAGQRLLILSEDETQGHYDPELGRIVANAARGAGIEIEEITVPFAEVVEDITPNIVNAMSRADCTLFFARLGDQIRFLEYARNKRAIVSYALDAAMFTSTFGWAHHGAFTALKTLLDGEMAKARTIRVSCPLGTAFEGPGHASLLDESGDVSVARFPMSVFAPVPAEGFAGRIAQSKFLTGTCSRFYQPYAAVLEDVLYIDFKDNQITGFEGNPRDVATAQKHYNMVAGRFGIDERFVHSWHSGIHPGCAYTMPAGQNYERWCSGAFGNPRLLHVHTCGAFAPGEISLNIIDPTIEVDGVKIWEDGHLYPERIAGGSDILNTYPCAKFAFDHAAQAIGI